MDDQAGQRARRRRADNERTTRSRRAEDETPKVGGREDNERTKEDKCRVELVDGSKGYKWGTRSKLNQGSSNIRRIQNRLQGHEGWNERKCSVEEETPKVKGRDDKMKQKTQR